MIVSDGRTRDVYPALQGVLGVLRRRRYVLVLPVLICVATGVASYGRAPLTYTSEAVLALDARRVQALPTEAVVSPLPQESPALRTELDLIGSRLMAAKVIARLEADGVEIREEEPQRQLPAAMAELVAFVEKALGMFSAVAEPGPEPAPASGDDERVKIDRLLANLRVNNDGRSYTIFISFSAVDPVYAAQVANAYASSYIDHHIAVQSSATRRVSDWLGEKLISLRAELEASEKAAEAFRQEAGLVRMEEGSTLQAQRVSALNAELVAARAELTGVQARLDTVRSLAAEGEIPALAEILGSASIQALRTDQVRLERAVDELRSSGAVRSARLGTLNAELDSLREQMAREVQRVIDSLANEIAVAHRKEVSLRGALREAEQELAAAGRATVAMGQLEREANANRTIYESFLVRYKQTIEQDGITAPEAQVISFAEPAAARVSPRLSTWLFYWLALGGGIGVFGAMLREVTDRRPQLAELLETMTGVPVIGILPQLSRRERRRIAQQARDASSRFGRLMTALRVDLGTGSEPNAPLTVVLTSAFQGEGKTTLALGMGRAAAAAGLRAVVVDANLRDPMVEKALGVKATSYIDEIAGEGKDVAQLLRKDPLSELNFIAARTGAAAPEALFVSRNFTRLLSELKNRFDLILIDTPGLRQAADVMALAASADKTLFVMRFGGKRLRETAASARSLVSCARDLHGIVLNRVDRRFYAELAERPSHPRRIAAAPSGERPSTSMF